MVIAYLTIPRTDDDTDWWRWYVAGRGRGVNLRPDDTGTTRAALNVMTDVRGIDALDRDAQVSLLRRAFAGAGWQTDRILDALDDARSTSRTSPRSTSTGGRSARVVLTGDAAGAPPRSAASAPRSRCPAPTPSPPACRARRPPRRLRRLRRRMRPFVDKGQSLPPGTPGLANPQSELGRRLFGTALRLAASPLAQRLGSVSSRFTKPPPADTYQLPGPVAA